MHPTTFVRKSGGRGPGSSVQHGFQQARPHCRPRLVSLALGNKNNVGVGGVTAVAQHCLALEALEVGENSIGAAGAAAIGQYSRGLARRWRGTEPPPFTGGGGASAGISTPPLTALFFLGPGCWAN